MGGAWEWTSTVLEEWVGFRAMKEYPGYTGKFVLISDPSKPVDRYGFNNAIAN